MGGECASSGPRHGGARTRSRIGPQFIVRPFGRWFDALGLGWDARPHPDNLDAIDWRKFQQEYRDHIDLAKMAQLIPLIGAPVGAVVNYRLVDRLGDCAIGAYRMRWFEKA